MSHGYDPRAVRRVALYGPFGWGNLGDAAIQDAMIHNARRRRPDLEFLGVSLNPENTETIHGIPAIPIERNWRPRRPAAASSASGAPGSGRRRASASFRTALLSSSAVLRTKELLRPSADLVREVRFLVRSLPALRGVQLFLFSGGGQLADFWGGPWYHPYSMLKFAACARVAGATVRVVSVGAGPIRHRLSGWFLHLTLRLAHGRSYRDVESRELLSPWGFPRRDPVVPDLAFSHPRGEVVPPAPSERGREVVVGLSPLAYCHPAPGPWPRQDAGRYAAYFQVIESTCASLLREGSPVVLFNSQIRNDRYAFDDLLASLARQDLVPDGTRFHAEVTEGLDHLFEQITRADVVITSRLHGVILAYLLHRPVISLSYDPKIDAVMRHFGQSEFCLDIETTRAPLLQARLRAMIERLPEIRARVRSVVQANRARLEAQYDELFGPVPASGGMEGR